MNSHAASSTQTDKKGKSLKRRPGRSRGRVKDDPQSALERYLENPNRRNRMGNDVEVARQLLKITNDRNRPYRCNECPNRKWMKRVSAAVQHLREKHYSLLLKDPEQGIISFAVPLQMSDFQS